MALNHITYVTFHCALTGEILKLLSIFQGTGVGDKRNPSDPASQALDPKTKSSLRLRFRVRNCNGLPRVISETQVANANAEDNNAGWDAVLWKGRLYVLVDSAQMTDSGSKEAFVALLEYAEEVLEVSHVIVCIDRPDIQPIFYNRYSAFKISGFRPYTKFDIRLGLVFLYL